MTPEYVVSLGSEAIKLTLLLSAPLLGVGLVVGLLIAVLQATTQIQEMTLSFVPKILAVLLALLVAAPWMLDKMAAFTTEVITNIPHVHPIGRKSGMAFPLESLEQMQGFFWVFLRVTVLFFLLPLFGATGTPLPLEGRCLLCHRAGPHAGGSAPDEPSRKRSRTCWWACFPR